MAVHMELSRIFIREIADGQIIELSEVGGSRTFPIVIGLPEAWAIDRRLKGGRVERPQTHDLLSSVIEALGAEVRRVVINDLSNGTFYARLVLVHDGEEIEVDSRPSDAIAIAVADDADIYVDELVLEAVERDRQQNELTGGAEELDDFDDDDDEPGLDWT